jgi:hypothetical protein
VASLNGIFIIPTGLGCALGGDAAYNPGVKLIAACSQTLIVNPNAVNASDINELPENALYVEGSTIDRFLEGKLNLQKVKKYNRILMAVNPPSIPANFNSANAGVWGLGGEVEVLVLNTPLKMKATLSPEGIATGEYSGIDELVEQVSKYDFDALALHTDIDYDLEMSTNYWLRGGVNPWGGIEAIVSRQISERVNRPVAHAPVDMVVDDDVNYKNHVVKLSMAPEIISNTYLFCVLKGLHRSPHLEFDLTKGLSRTDIDFMVSPHGCFGRPHQACVDAQIPMIIVKENTTCFSKGFTYPVEKGLIFVNNYLEAAGVILAMSSGVSYKTIISSSPRPSK